MLINFETMDDFHQTISTAFKNALAASPPAEWPRIATEIRSSSKRNTYPFLGEIDDMRKWVGPRVIKQLEAHRYAIENEKFELTIRAEVDQIEDDQGGAVSMYSSLAEIKARAVALQPDQLMMGEVVPGGTTNLCYDGQFFFDTDHPVGKITTANVSNDMGGSDVEPWYLLDLSKPLKPFIYQNRLDPVLAAMTDFNNPHVFMLDEFIWGVKRRNAGGYGLWQSAVRSRKTPSATSIREAWLAMNNFENDEGRKLGMNPTLLLCGTSTRFAFEDLLKLQVVQSASGNAGVTSQTFNMVPMFASQYLP